MFKRLENFFTSPYRLLSRFSRLERKVGEIIRERIPKAECSVRLLKRELFISAPHPSLQSELFLRREELLQRIQEHFGEGVVERITIQKF
jgi:hypothetical protein